MNRYGLEVIKAECNFLNTAGGLQKVAMEKQNVQREDSVEQQGKYSQLRFIDTFMAFAILITRG